MRHVSATLLVVAAAVGLALAQTPVDERRPADRDARVTVENIAGSVRVIGWSRDEVQVTGTLGKGTERLEVEGDQRHVTIRVRIPVNHGRDVEVEGSDLEVRLPRDGDIEVETVSASVSVSEISGPLDLESVSGDIDVSGRSRKIEASSVSGTITVAPDEPLEAGEFETVSGRIEFEGDVESGGRLSAEAVNGDIRLRLDPSVSASFAVETFSGQIENELGPPAKKSGSYSPLKELTFSIGGGSAQISIKTLNGDVEILSR